VTLGRLSATAQGAWGASLLGELPPAVATVFAGEAREVRLPAGTLVHRGGRNADLLVLVVAGLARCYMRSHLGRELTTRYVSESGLIGLPSLIEGSGNVRIQAVTDLWIVHLPGRYLATIAARDAEVAWPLVRFLARQIHIDQELLAENVFFSVQARVCRHLLDLATRDAGQLVVNARRQDIANAIGSVRTVVSRALGALREEGVIAERGSQIVLVDPGGLHALARGTHRSEGVT
jgi:CRP/FNR family transcriptional regulator, cyclic AMP receptor protein